MKATDDHGMHSNATAKLENTKHWGCIGDDTHDTCPPDTQVTQRFAMVDRLRCEIMLGKMVTERMDDNIRLKHNIRLKQSNQ